MPGTGFMVELPVPPSVNALYGTARRGSKRPRYRTRRYEAWIKAAGWELIQQRPTAVTGRCKVYLTLGRVRADPDNLIKPTLDLLVSYGLIPDDRAAYVVHVEAHIAPELPRDRAIVSVEVVS